MKAGGRPPGHSLLPSGDESYVCWEWGGALRPQPHGHTARALGVVVALTPGASYCLMGGVAPQPSLPLPAGHSDAC